MLKTYEAEVCVDGIWHCQPVVILSDLKIVNIEAERVLFESTNRVPNGVFWAGDYYNFTKGTDQTTWMMFNNKWYGWLECAQVRAKQAEQLEGEQV